MTKIANITLVGCSGKQYTFSVYPIETSFKAFGGVYYVSKRTVLDGKGKHKDIYLGITNDLSSRFNDHHKQDCFENNEANCLSIYLSDSEEERKKIEEDLLCNYNFTCNVILNK